MNRTEQGLSVIAGLTRNRLARIQTAKGLQILNQVQDDKSRIGHQQ
jgi:hypothetical protein